MDKFMSSQEIAQRLAVSKKTVYRLRVGGHLAYHTIGSSIRISQDQLNAYLDQNCEPAFNKRTNAPLNF